MKPRAKFTEGLSLHLKSWINIEYGKMEVLFAAFLPKKIKDRVGKSKNVTKVKQTIRVLIGL